MFMLRCMDIIWKIQDQRQIANKIMKYFKEQITEEPPSKQREAPPDTDSVISRYGLRIAL